ncbi:MAG: VCBS repeat-containing protein [Flavobacteriales bacterium]|nr:VCBS repeat-containing protein [Flavobacteriales bacterium]
MDQADVDLDGTLDLLYFNKFPGDAAVMIAKNNGIGSGFHAAVRNTSIPDPVVHAMFANVNSDGYPDILLVLYNSSSLYWMRNNGSGSFLAALPLYATPSNLGRVVPMRRHGDRSVSRTGRSGGGASRGRRISTRLQCRWLEGHRDRLRYGWARSFLSEHGLRRARAWRYGRQYPEFAGSRGRLASRRER